MRLNGYWRCPGLDGFRKRQATLAEALVVRIALPREVMFSAAHPEIGRLLHHIVAAVENAAVGQGFAGAAGFAGGSCKRAFCDDHPACRVLHGDGRCRHPDEARPSLSGFGVDVNRLMKTCGWADAETGHRSDADGPSLARVVGFVLL
jgi:predicted metal-binding protein